MHQRYCHTNPTDLQPMAENLDVALDWPWKFCAIPANPMDLLYRWRLTNPTSKRMIPRWLTNDFLSDWHLKIKKDHSLSEDQHPKFECPPILNLYLSINCPTNYLKSWLVNTVLLLFSHTTKIFIRRLMHEEIHFTHVQISYQLKQTRLKVSLFV